MEDILFEHEQSCVRNCNYRLCLSEDHEKNWNHFTKRGQPKEELLKTIDPVEVAHCIIIYSYCIFVALGSLAIFVNALGWVYQTTTFAGFLNVKVNLVITGTLGHAIRLLVIGLRVWPGFQAFKIVVWKHGALSIQTHALLLAMFFLKFDYDSSVILNSAFRICQLESQLFNFVLFHQAPFLLCLQLWLYIVEIVL